MEDMETVLMELSSLEKTPQVASIPPCLDEYLASVASTGKAVFAWAKVKPLFRRKLELIIQEFSESSPVENLARQPNVDLFNFEQMKERIFEQLESYTGLPFTIQRLCELMVQPKKHYKRIDKYMRGLEKVMLVVSTVDPIPGTGEPEATKTETSGSSDNFESPSKRIRLASAEEDEAGPCDSADSEAGPEPSAELHNGVNGSSEAAEAGGSDASAGEENMDIDTECTSSQARLSVTDTASADNPGSDDQSSGGVESTADPAPSPHIDTDSPMDTEAEDRLAASDPGPVASSSGDGVTSDGVTTSDQDQTPASIETEASVEDSGAASSSGDQASAAVRAQETDTNSEAEPAASDKENFTEAAVEQAEAEAGSSAQGAEEQQEVASPSVQSSEEPSQTESSAPPASITDSGAADSSDQAQAPAQGEVTASEAGGEATPSVTSEAAEAVSSDQASTEKEAEAEASDNSPDQSDTPAHAQ